MRLAIALGALALGAGGFTVTVLPRPTFPGPSAAPGGPHRLVLVSSRYHAPQGPVLYLQPASRFNGLPSQATFSTANRLFVAYGTDGSTARYVVAETKTGKRLYAFDFASYAWPPRIRPGEREFVYEQPQWAEERNGVSYFRKA